MDSLYAYVHVFHTVGTKCCWKCWTTAEKAVQRVSQKLDSVINGYKNSSVKAKPTETNAAILTVVFSEELLYRFYTNTTCEPFQISGFGPHQMFLKII